MWTIRPLDPGEEVRRTPHGNHCAGNRPGRRAGRHPAVHRLRADQRLGDDQVSNRTMPARQICTAWPSWRGSSNGGCAIRASREQLLVRQGDAEEEDRRENNAMPRSWAAIIRSHRRHSRSPTKCTAGRVPTSSLSAVLSDVLHSFTLPNLRLKQDACPARRFPCGSTPTEAATVA